jgi:hypothetical protein
MYAKRMLLIALLVTSAGATAAPAQVLGKVRQQIKQKIAGAKIRLEDSVATHATEPLDSVLTRAVRPVDSTAKRASSGASVVVGSAVGRKQAGGDEQRIRDGLSAGRLEMTTVTFDSEVPSNTSGPSLDALARVLTSMPNMFLIQVRLEIGMVPETMAKTVADQRAAAVKAWLVSRGVPAGRVFAASDGQQGASGGLVTIVRLQ